MQRPPKGALAAAEDCTASSAKSCRSSHSQFWLLWEGAGNGRMAIHFSLTCHFFPFPAIPLRIVSYSCGRFTRLNFVSGAVSRFAISGASSFPEWGSVTTSLARETPCTLWINSSERVCERKKQNAASGQRFCLIEVHAIMAPRRQTFFLSMIQLQPSCD